MDENFLHIVRCDVLFNITVSLYVMPCSLVEKHRFTKTFASTRAEGQGTRPICIGASLPNYAMLQPTRHWLSLICFLKLKSMRSQTTVCTMTTGSFISTWNGILSLLPVNGNSPPIVQTTVCAVSNPIQWFLLCGVVFVEQFKLLFKQQYVLWATQFNGFFCVVWCLWSSLWGVVSCQVCV